MPRIQHPSLCREAEESLVPLSPFEVDYRRPLERHVVAGRYFKRDPHVRQDLFALEAKGVCTLEPAILRLNRGYVKREPLAEFVGALDARRPWRLAGIGALLGVTAESLAAYKRETERRLPFWLVALGSIALVPPAPEQEWASQLFVGEAEGSVGLSAEYAGDHDTNGWRTGHRWFLLTRDAVSA